MLVDITDYLDVPARNEALEKLDLLVKKEAITHNVGECYRCSDTIEPMISKQWFVKMDKLALPAIDWVKEGKTKFIPARFEKIYFNWLNNGRRWQLTTSSFSLILI